MGNIENNDIIENKGIKNDNTELKDKIAKLLDQFSQKIEKTIEEYENILKENSKQETTETGDETQSNKALKEEIKTDIKDINNTIKKLSSNNLNPEILQGIEGFNEITNTYIQRIITEINNNYNNEEIISIIQQSLGPETVSDEEIIKKFFKTEGGTTEKTQKEIYGFEVPEDFYTIKKEGPKEESDGKKEEAPKGSGGLYSPKITTKIEVKNENGEIEQQNKTGTIIGGGLFGRGDQQKNENENNGALKKGSQKTNINTKLNGTKIEEYKTSGTTNLKIEKDVKIPGKDEDEAQIGQGKITNTQLHVGEKDETADLRWNGNEDFSMNIAGDITTGVTKKSINPDQKETEKNNTNSERIQEDETTIKVGITKNSPLTGEIGVSNTTKNTGETAIQSDTYTTNLNVGKDSFTGQYSSTKIEKVDSKPADEPTPSGDGSFQTPQLIDHEHTTSAAFGGSIGEHSANVSINTKDAYNEMTQQATQSGSYTANVKAGEYTVNGQYSSTKIEKVDPTPYDEPTPGGESSSQTPQLTDHSNTTSVSFGGSVDNYSGNVSFDKKDIYDKTSKSSIKGETYKGTFKANGRQYNAGYTTETKNDINTTGFDVGVINDEIGNGKIKYLNSEDGSHISNIEGEVKDLGGIQYSTITTGDKTKEEFGINKVKVGDATISGKVGSIKNGQEEKITGGASATINTHGADLGIGYEYLGNGYNTVSAEMGTEKGSVKLQGGTNKELGSHIIITGQGNDILGQKIRIGGGYSENKGFRVCTGGTLYPVENFTLQYNLDYIRTDTTKKNINDGNSQYTQKAITDVNDFRVQEIRDNTTPTNTNYLTTQMSGTYKLDKDKSINLTGLVTLNDKPVNINGILSYEQNTKLGIFRVGLECRNMFQESRHYLGTFYYTPPSRN